MLFNSYSYEILYEQCHWKYLQGDIKLVLVTVNNSLKFEIEIVHDLSCHPIQSLLQLTMTYSYTSYTNFWSVVYEPSNEKTHLHNHTVTA